MSALPTSSRRGDVCPLPAWQRDRDRRRLVCEQPPDPRSGGVRGHSAGHQAGGQKAPGRRGRPRGQGIEAGCRPQPASLGDRVADLGVGDPSTQCLGPCGQPELAGKEGALSFPEVRKGSLSAAWHIEEYFMSIDVTSSSPLGWGTGCACPGPPSRRVLVPERGCGEGNVLPTTIFFSRSPKARVGQDEPGLYASPDRAHRNAGGCGPASGRSHPHQASRWCPWELDSKLAARGLPFEAPTVHGVQDAGR